MNGLAHIADSARQADELLALRRDNAALRAALERSQAERDSWRVKYHDLAFRREQALHRLHATIKECLA